MNPYNQDINDGVILSEHKIVPTLFYRRIGIGFLIVATLIGFCWVVVYYNVAPQQYEAELERRSNAELAALVATDNGVPFEMVPQALVSPLLNPVMDQSPETLRSDYSIARDMAQLGDGNKPLKEELWAIDINGVTYADFANNLPTESQLTLFQMIDELREVAYQIGESNNIESLSVRIGEETTLLYPELAIPRVGKDTVFYPNPFTLEAYFVTSLLARVFPDKATYYEQRGEEIAMAGVAYGHYSIAEKDAMTAYIAWYINEAAANSNFQTLLTAMQAVANQTVQ